MIPLKRRLASVLLAACLVVSLLPTSALAANGDLPEGCTINYKAETLMIPNGYSLYEAEDSATALFTASDENNNTYNITKHISSFMTATLYLQASATEGEAATERTSITIPARPVAPNIMTSSIDYEKETRLFWWHTAWDCHDHLCHRNYLFFGLSDSVGIGKSSNKAVQPFCV